MNTFLSRDRSGAVHRAVIAINNDTRDDIARYNDCFFVPWFRSMEHMHCLKWTTYYRRWLW